MKLISIFMNTSDSCFNFYFTKITHNLRLLLDHQHREQTNCDQLKNFLIQ